MRDNDCPPHDKTDGEGVKNLLALCAEFVAAVEVVANTIVAAQDEGSDEAEELLGVLRERPALVSERVEGIESLDHAVVGGENTLVESGAFGSEFFWAHGHGRRLH
jgi:hypothetical protein